MENYKIKLNNEAESKEAQDLFEQLGFKWAGDHPGNGDWYSHLYAENSICCYLSPYVWGGLVDRFKEITLSQLRDLVVLHRNDVKDATHACDGMNGAAIKLSGIWYGYNYFVNKWQPWDEIEDDEYKISDLKPIQKSLEQGLISGADALRALADGKEVQCTITGKNDWTKDIYGIQPYYFLGGGIGQFQFRLKPRTITLNVEIPAPFEPKDGEIYYFINSSNLKGYGFNKFSNDGDDECLTFYGAWRTEEEIKKVVAALRRGIKA